MGWIVEQIQCPRCGFENAQQERKIEGRNRSVICIRCGYSKDVFFNHEKYESLKSSSEGQNDWELMDQCWLTEEIFPKGSYIFRKKHTFKNSIGAVSEEILDDLTKDLDKYDHCKYTFNNMRSWYMKDLHDGTIELFSVEKYRGLKTIEDSLDLDMFEDLEELQIFKELMADGMIEELDLVKQVKKFRYSKGFLDNKGTVSAGI